MKKSILTATFAMSIFAAMQIQADEFTSLNFELIRSGKFTELESVSYEEVLKEQQICSSFECRANLPAFHQKVLAKFEEFGSKFIPKLPEGQVGYINKEGLFVEYVSETKIPEFRGFSSVVVVPFTRDGGGNVFVHKHSEPDTYGYSQDFWSFAGGLVDDNQFLSSALNELYEESGFQLPERMIVRGLLSQQIKENTIGFVFLEIPSMDSLQAVDSYPELPLQYWPFRYKLKIEGQDSVKVLFPRERGDYDCEKAGWAKIDVTVSEEAPFVDISSLENDRKYYKGRFGSFARYDIQKILGELIAE